MTQELFLTLVRAEIDDKRGKLFNTYTAKEYLKEELPEKSYERLKAVYEEEQLVRVAEVYKVFTEFYEEAVKEER